MTFGEPIQLQIDPAAKTSPENPEITFGEPVKLSAPAPTFGEPRKAVTFAPPVDVLSDDAPIGLFEKWKSEQPETSVGESIGNAAGHVLSGASEAIKTIFERATSSARAILDPSLNADQRFDKLITKNVALASEVGAEAFKGFATTGSYLISKGEKLREATGPLLGGEDKARDAEAHVASLKAERAFYRNSRDLQASANDGRVIAQAITSHLGDRSNELIGAPVNEEGARFISNFVDPDAGAFILTAAARGIGADLAKVAVKQLPFTGELAALEKQVAEAQARKFATETEILAAKGAGADASALEKSLSKDVSALEEANQVFKNKVDYYDSQAVALGLQKEAGKGFIQRGTGLAVETAGKVAQGVGNVVGGVNTKLDEVLSHFSQGSAAGEKVVDHAAGRLIPGNSIRYALEGGLKSAGRDVSIAGKLISQTESSLPYFQSLARALPEGSVGRWAASQAERFEFLATTGRWAMDTAEAGAKGAGLGAAFGTLSGDPVDGAVQGVFFGMAGQQYGQFAKMNSKAEVFLRQQTDIELSRKRAESRGPEALKAFDKLPQGGKLLVATMETAHPDVYVNPTGSNGVSWYDYNGSVGEIGIDPKNPLTGALTHELKHHLGRNPAIAQAIETKLLGDPNSGVTGLFTARDVDGKPIVIETPDAQNPENVRKSFQLTPEFFDLREQYLGLLKAKGLPTIDYERSNQLIAHEIFAESQSANLLNRQANGEFDIVGIQRMGPAQRKIADLFADSDLVNNSVFLQKSLAKFGIVFDGLSGRAANTDLFHRSVEIPGMTKLLRKYYEQSDRERTVATEPESFGTKHYTEGEILKSPELTELFASGHDVVRDPVSGKLHFVGEKEAKARSKEFYETLTSELDQYAGNEPGVVKKVTTVDANGRTSEAYLGKKIPDSVVAKMEASGKFNEHQLVTLSNTGKLLTEGKGTEVNMFYQPASKRGGTVYRTRPITERTETPMTIKITKDGNVVINTISQEKLMRNAVNMIKSKKAVLWGNDFQKLWGDVQVYLENHAQGLAGDANGLGVDKKNFINSLFGQFTKEQREFNPFLQETSERQARNNGIVQSRRLDRINKLLVLDSTFKPDYSKVARNYSPGRPKHEIPVDEVLSLNKSVSGWILPDGKLIFGKYSFMHKELAQGRGFKSIDALKEAGGERVVLGETSTGERSGELLLGVDRLSELPEVQQKGIRRLANDYDLDVRLDTGKYLPKQFSPGGSGKALEHSLGDGDLNFTHFSGSQGLKELDPKHFGKSGITPHSEFAGLPRSYAYAEGSKFGQDKGLIDKRANRYTGSVPKGKLYDGVKDPLDIYGMVNREKRDQTLLDRGYIGIYNEGGKGVKQVEFFKKVPVKPVTPDNTVAKSKKAESRGVLRPALHETDKQFSPGGNPESRSIAEEYTKRAGLPLNPHTGYDELPEPKIRALADYFQNEAKHDPENPEVARSYAALATETKAQYDAMVEAGIKIEPFTGSGEPYKSSLEMMADVQDNKHLAFFLTDSGFGSTEAAANNPLLAPSGIKIGDRELLVNDLFRAVHDFFGHTQQGFQFGPRGEFNAWKEHSRMFSDEAQGALAAETLAQNAWVNFGPHLRDTEGKIPKKGEPGFVAPQDRPFAEQKTFVVPAELRQFSPGSDGVEKVAAPAVKLEDGTVVSAGPYTSHQELMDTLFEDGRLNPDDPAPKERYGFVSSTGRFLERVEAFKLAREAGQVGKKKVPVQGLHTDQSIRFSPGPKELADEPLRISTRVPSAKASTENSLTSQLSISARDVLPDADARKEVAAIIKKYPNIPAGLKKPDEVLKAFHDHIVSNLLYLHDQFDPALRERSKLWYDGARKLTEKWSDSYDIPREGVAGVLASLSPQKDWFMNVDLARRVIEHSQALKKRNLSDGMVDWFRGKFAESNPELMAVMENKVGTPYTDLGFLEKAVMLRAFDEAAHDRGYQIITPEGDFSGPATKQDGGAAKVAWGGFNTIAKAISSAENPSRDNIHRQLGQEHKVRNFFNNILLPNLKEHGDVTIDTHAVAAALLRPLAGGDIEVGHNLGGGRSSAITGASGLYGLYADAYRDAAAQRGRLAREMQSITWEAVRGLFTPEFKTAANKEAVDSIWKQHKLGTLSLDDARKQIFDLAGGITAPSWSGPGR